MLRKFLSFFVRRKSHLVLPAVTFATACWERDWEIILHDPDYLRVRQIENHRFPFAEKVLIINNVKNREAVRQAAEKKIAEGVLTRFVFAEELAPRLLPFFRLQRTDFRIGSDAHLYQKVDADWIYYNALAPLSAVYDCKTPYLLYLTGDVWLNKPVDWIEPALVRMERSSQIKVANLTWNQNFAEAKRESYRRDRDFFVSVNGFSDQMFLVRRSDFRAAIYNEIRADAGRFPRGDVFEKRVFSYMKNRGWERITFRRGSYIHK